MTSAPDAATVPDDATAASPAAAPLDHLAELTVLQDQFLATIDLVDPATPVPSCGDWTVRDLVEHVAEIHHWAAAQARREEVEPLAPASSLTARYADAAAELRSTLAALSPDAPAWTLDDSNVTAFWRRRQLHETLIHLWDLRTAAGLPLDVAPAIWADAVDEVVTVMQPRQERLGRMAPLHRALRIDAADRAATWLLGPGTPLVTVAGTSRSVALLLWRRTGADLSDLHVTGARDVLDDALGAGLTP
ncbi:maleylpyruvate isomerase family mycothiol-dependent enzyme [Cellulomonas sp. JH27-2]|uniref:maleylpyruvate isomerase family mycothiol-dependent enzyme n=1 Tax=Cellulomonas sp. JH27-2 TaxID=2774139 RepID=UPI001780911B|nr:maleylpyruvate isomerase family mycothiol-dependent enzyme [Cellulomonas sp. JH27-2]MBD8058431.1 maleylpyruvate isomerase family mycothiol-dependent enzyme [Cellulomonas sp. JH27-2]